MAVAALTRKAPAKVDDPLVLAEVEALEAHYRKHPGARVHPDTPFPRFVNNCFKRHRTLIQHWGGWSKSIQVTEVMQSPDQIVDTITPILKRWREGAQLKNKTLPPVPMLLRSDLEDFDSPEQAYERLEATGAYCQLFGCHRPTPILFSPLYANRTYKGRDGSIPYATGCSVNLRSGQAVSRAVLSDVKRRFKQDPTYVAFWEAVFESLGIVWAGGKPATFKFSTAPTDFLRLGNLGENSCFRDGGEFEKSKLYLAQVPNSVVVIIERDKRVIGRCWGILAPKAGGGEFSNFYLSPRHQLIPGLRAALREALEVNDQLEVNEDDFSSAINGLNSALIYLNEDTVMLHPENKSGAVEDELSSAVNRFDKAHLHVSAGDSDDDEY